MTVIPFPHRPPPRPDPTWPPHWRSVPIHGTFPAPSGRCGMMIGSLRLEHVRVSAGQSWVDGVFTGDLFNAEGEHIGACSRRQSAPARLGESPDAPISVGPVEVDLMGLVVTVSAVSLPSARPPVGRGHGQPARRHTGTHDSELSEGTS